MPVGKSDLQNCQITVQSCQFWRLNRLKTETENVSGSPNLCEKTKKH
jgi:hypothetical protein